MGHRTRRSRKHSADVGAGVPDAGTLSGNDSQGLPEDVPVPTSTGYQGGIVPSHGEPPASNDARATFVHRRRSTPHLAAYALGALPPHERATVSADLASSPELRTELQALLPVAQLLQEHSRRSSGRPMTASDNEGATEAAAVSEEQAEVTGTPQPVLEKPDTPFRNRADQSIAANHTPRTTADSPLRRVNLVIIALALLASLGVAIVVSRLVSGGGTGATDEPLLMLEPTSMVVINAAASPGPSPVSLAAPRFILLQ